MKSRPLALVLVLAFGTAGWAGAPPGYNPEPEQIANGDFSEGVDSWSLWGGEIGPWGRGDGAGVKVSNALPKWSGADQILTLGDGAGEVRVSGWIRAENIVPGSQSWEMGRIAVEFFDDAGAQVGGYPPVVAQVSGTTPWTEARHTYSVPKGAAKIKVQCALGNATGSVFCDDFSASFKSSSGGYLRPKAASGPLDFGSWYDIEPAAADAHYADWSSLLDAPAGKRGWVAAKGDKLVFEDGSVARFWGVNVVASDVFGTHAMADSLATRLSKMGANLVRLHHMDAPWSKPNIFGNGATTRVLDSASLDRLDYLHAALKKRGIYIMPDLLVHREFTAADGVKEPANLGAKQVGIFSRKLIELQKEYARNLLGHVNPYTKLAWKDDPSVALTEFINESTIFTQFDPGTLPGSYRKELDSLWKAGKNTGELASFDFDWSLGNRGNLRASDPSQARKSLEFLSHLERAYYDTMRAAIRSTGAKLMMAGTNFPPAILATLLDQTKQDLVISNDYWDHPQIWKINNDWDRVDWSPLDNRSQLRNPSENLVATKSWFALQGKPLLITEWNHCLPNEYEVEALPLLSAYAAFQGWSGALQFDFDPKGLGSAPLKRYTLSRSPSMLALWTVAAPLFLRSDVAESKDSVIEFVDSAKAFSTPSYSDFLEKRWALPYRVKVRKTFTGKSHGSPDTWDRPGLRDTGIAISSTRELELDTKSGILRIETPRTQGAVGALAGRTFVFPRFSFSVANPQASVVAVSIDGKPLAESRHFYLVAVGPSRMKDQAFTRSRTGIKALGTLPVQSQILEGSLVLKGKDLAKTRIYATNSNGTRGHVLATTIAASGTSLDLSKARTPVLEIVLTDKE